MSIGIEGSCIACPVLCLQVGGTDIDRWKDGVCLVNIWLDGMLD